MYERRGLRTGSETPRLNLFALVAWWFFLSTQRASRPCGAMSEQLLLKPYDNVLNYSHSFTLVCRGAILIGSSLVVVLSTLPPNPSACPRVSVWDKPWDKFANYFETASPQLHFCPRNKNGLVLRP